MVIPLPNAATKSRAACVTPFGQDTERPSAVLRHLAIARYYLVGVPCGLTAQRLAGHGFIYVVVSK